MRLRPGHATLPTCIAGLLLACVLTAQHALAGVFHERVIWTEKPTSEAIVSWSSDHDGVRSMVYFDTVSQQGRVENYSQRSAAKVKGQFLGSRARPTYYHHARLDGLVPNTWYYFVVATDGSISSEFSFRTAPESGEFKLLFGGDSRTNVEQRLVMNRLMAKRLSADPEIYGLVFGGDYIDDGNRFPEWMEWLDHFQETRAGQRLLPIVPIRGNHEATGELFNQVWDTPGGSGNYFTTLIGSLAIVNLNSNISHYGEQRQWLEGQLSQLSVERRYIVANYHRPAYPAYKKPGEARGAWVPLFEQYKLDLVFESDGHTYKQTSPIYRDNEDQERGIIYVGEGGLGAPLRTPVEHWYLKGRGMAARAYHLLELEVKANAMEYRAIGEDGTVFAELTLRAKR